MRLPTSVALSVASLPLRSPRSSPFLGCSRKSSAWRSCSRVAGPTPGYLLECLEVDRALAAALKDLVGELGPDTGLDQLVAAGRVDVGLGHGSFPQNGLVHRRSGTRIQSRAREMVPLQCSKTFHNLHINGVEIGGGVQLLVHLRKELQLRRRSPPIVI